MAIDQTNPKNSNTTKATTPPSIGKPGKTTNTDPAKKPKQNEAEITKNQAHKKSNLQTSPNDDNSASSDDETSEYDLSAITKTNATSKKHNDKKPPKKAQFTKPPGPKNTKKRTLKPTDNPELFDASSSDDKSSLSQHTNKAKPKIVIDAQDGLSDEDAIYG
jgi:hypothetical protein